MEHQFNRSIIRSLADPEFRSIGALFVTMLIPGSIFYSSVEGWSVFNPLYFNVLTLVTVGYGGYSPNTVLGKAFTIVYVLVGIGILVGFVNAITKQSLEHQTMLSRRRHHGDTPATDSQNVIASPDDPQ